jgi:hypothetical protein
MLRSIVKVFIVLSFVNLGLAAIVKAQNSAGAVNEKFTIGALQILHSAQITYINVIAGEKYGSFTQLSGNQFIDAVLASGKKYGYTFSMTVVPGTQNSPARFQVSAVPQRYGKSGKRSFYLDESGVVRGADRNGNPATANDPLVQIPCGESGAISSVRWVSGAQATYEATAGLGNYGTLGQLSETGLIDAYLTSGEKCGYLFRVETTPRMKNTPPTFKVKAVPRIYQVTGVRSFYIDQNGVIRGADKGGAEANENDPPIEN